MSIIQHPGEFIRHRFMEPLSLSASELSRAIGVPRSRLSEILSGRRGVSVDTARRLGLYFGVDLQVFCVRRVRRTWPMGLSTCSGPTVLA